MQVAILLGPDHAYAPDELGVGPRHHPCGELLDRHRMVKAMRRLAVGSGDEDQAH